MYSKMIYIVILNELITGTVKLSSVYNLDMLVHVYIHLQHWQDLAHCYKIYFEQRSSTLYQLYTAYSRIFNVMSGSR
jgi:hypothetical protein